MPITFDGRTGAQIAGDINAELGASLQLTESGLTLAGNSLTPSQRSSASRGLGIDMPQTAGPIGLSALQALSLASVRRVDLVMIGDSNQAFGGYGFSFGLEKALAARFGVYATGTLTRTSSAQWSGGRLFADSQFVATGADADIADFGRPYVNFDPAGNGVKIQYDYVVSGAATGGNVIGGYTNQNTIDQNSALNVWYAYGVKNSLGGQCKPSARLEAAPFTTLATATSAVSNSDYHAGVRLVNLEIAAGSRAGGVGARFMAPNASAGDAVVGPFVSYYVRIENASKSSGVSCHTLYASGGQSAWTMARELQGTPDASLTTYFTEVRRLQIASGVSPIVIVYVNTGVNDRNNTRSPSRGPAHIFGAGDSPAEYVDNLRGIQDRIKRIWEINRWPLGELHWLIVPSHRIADPDDADLIAYRAAVASTLALEPQTSLINLGALMTAAEASAAGWYDGGGPVHMTSTGYDAVSALMVSQIPA